MVDNVAARDGVLFTPDDALYGTVAATRRRIVHSRGRSCLRFLAVLHYKSFDIVSEISFVFLTYMYTHGFEVLMKWLHHSPRENVATFFVFIRKHGSSPFSY